MHACMQTTTHYTQTRLCLINISLQQATPRILTPLLHYTFVTSPACVPRFTTPLLISRGIFNTQ